MHYNNWNSFLFFSPFVHLYRKLPQKKCQHLASEILYRIWKTIWIHSSHSLTSLSQGEVLYKSSDSPRVERLDKFHLGFLASGRKLWYFEVKILPLWQIYVHCDKSLFKCVFKSWVVRLMWMFVNLSWSGLLLCAHAASLHEASTACLYHLHSVTSYTIWFRLMPLSDIR